MLNPHLGRHSYNPRREGFGLEKLELPSFLGPQNAPMAIVE
jgi:hypothetical protein